MALFFKHSFVGAICWMSDLITHMLSRMIRHELTWIGKYPLYVLAHSGTGSPGNWITRPWLIYGSGEKWTHLLWWCMMNIWTFEKLQGFKDTKCSCHILSMVHAYRLVFYPSWMRCCPCFPICNNQILGTSEPTMCEFTAPSSRSDTLHYLHSTPSCTNHILLMEDIRNPGFHRLIGRIFLYLRNFWVLYVSDHLRYFSRRM